MAGFEVILYGRFWVIPEDGIAYASNEVSVFLNDKAACAAGAQSAGGFACNALPGASASPVDTMLRGFQNVLDNTWQGYRQFLVLCGATLGTQSLPPLPAPQITGVQGYDPAQQGTAAYTNGTVIAGTYLVIYGTFPTSENIVWIDGRSVSSSYQGGSVSQPGISQINIPVSGISAGAHSVAVAMGGMSGPEEAVPFTVSAGGNSAASGATNSPPSVLSGPLDSLDAAIAHAKAGCIQQGGNAANVTINGVPVTGGRANVCGSLGAVTQQEQQLKQQVTEMLQQVQQLGSSAAVDANVAAAPTTPTTFPANIIIVVDGLHVRSAPKLSAPLAGSQSYNSGQSFTASNAVTGDSVNGNNQWWLTSDGYYVWSGGTSMHANR